MCTCYGDLKCPYHSMGENDIPSWECDTDFFSFLDECDNTPKPKVSKRDKNVVFVNFKKS